MVPNWRRNTEILPPPELRVKSFDLDVDALSGARVTGYIKPQPPQPDARQQDRFRGALKHARPHARKQRRALMAELAEALVSGIDKKYVGDS